MPLRFQGFILLLTALTTALIAGLFYAYSCSVNPGLGKLNDSAYLAAMQNINLAIQNPLFFFSFMGTVILLPLSAYMNYTAKGSSRRFLCLSSAAVIYLLGTFGVTVFCNVPLNEALANFDLQSANAQELLEQRTNFETPWNKWHAVRTIAAVISLLLVLMACLSISRSCRDSDAELRP